MAETVDDRHEKIEKDFLEIKTPSGRIYKYFLLCGLYFPEEIIRVFDPRPNLPNLADMTVRDDDIFMCGFIRSGTNWIWEIVHMLMQGNAVYQKDRKDNLILEFQSQELFNEMDSPRILPTHLRFEYLPKEIRKKNCKIIYVQRNPKDVAVSHFNFRKSEVGVDALWEDYLHTFLETTEDCYISWLGTTKSWEKALKEYPDLPILIVYFEDMKKDPSTEIAKIAKFLDIKTDQRFIAEIVEKISFSKMKNAKLQYLSEKLKENPEMQDRRENRLESRSKYYRKGEVGNWKNQFTVAQNEYFDRVFSERMKNTTLQLQYSI